MISRYLQLIRLSLRQITEKKTESPQTLRAQSFPKKTNFGTFLSVANALLRAPAEVTDDWVMEGNASGC